MKHNLLCLLERVNLYLRGRSNEMFSVLVNGENGKRRIYISLLFILVLKSERIIFFFQIQHVTILSVAKSRERWW